MNVRNAKASILPIACCCRTPRGCYFWWIASLLAVTLWGAVIPMMASTVHAARGLRAAAILVNMDTGKTLFEAQADASIPPASLAKIMSLYLVFDALNAKKLSLRQKIRIPAAAAAVGGSTMHLRAGERVSVHKLLAGTAVASGNDAVTALALRIEGNLRRFVQAMNAKARTLGIRHTTFRNPSGLPAAGQRTTARDMAKLTCAYLKAHPEAWRYHGMYTITHRRRVLYTTNTLLGVVPGATGLKTGWTLASGYNIIVTATRGKTRLLAVVMGSSSRKARDALAAKLLRVGFRHGSNSKRIYAAMGYGVSPKRRHRLSRPSAALGTKQTPPTRQDVPRTRRR